jgi:hypothetical protein
MIPYGSEVQALISESNYLRDEPKRVHKAFLSSSRYNKLSTKHNGKLSHPQMVRFLCSSGGAPLWSRCNKWAKLRINRLYEVSIRRYTVKLASDRQHRGQTAPGQQSAKTCPGLTVKGQRRPPCFVTTVVLYGLTSFSCQPSVFWPTEAATERSRGQQGGAWKDGKRRTSP